jgi:hypothetical protein
MYFNVMPAENRSMNWWANEIPATVSLTPNVSPMRPSGSASVYTGASLKPKRPKNTPNPKSPSANGNARPAQL